MERIVTQPKGSRDDADAFVDDRLTFGLRRASADVPQGWIMHEHPSGWLYFTHEILRIVTDDDIRDPALLASLENQISIMPPIPDKCEIQLHARFANRRFVNHDAALAGYSLKAVYGPQVDCLDAGALIRLRKLYWSFLQEHPCHAPLPPGAEDDVVESMTTFHTENVMFDNLSPSPFSDTEIEKLLDILQTHHALTTRPQSPSRTVFVAWLLRRIYGHRDAASHGRHTRKFFDELLLAKQAPPQSIQPSERLSLITKVCLGTLMSFFLWAVPYSYLQHLRNAMEYRGRLSDVQLRWEHYISKLVREWTDFNLVVCIRALIKPALFHNKGCRRQCFSPPQFHSSQFRVLTKFR
ncbi:hypothetical protein BKA62DRAFT_613097 [Auriculariales sp. MPI-PUGE-AT-0066]|nr:hypothetical protein BKA62DRAFT_613097 [Auriculariales sp. MPI-PUGE-AT-0066]